MQSFMTASYPRITNPESGGFPMPILTKRTDKTPLGIYIHIPFCRSK